MGDPFARNSSEGARASGTTHQVVPDAVAPSEGSPIDVNIPAEGEQGEASASAPAVSAPAASPAEMSSPEASAAAPESVDEDHEGKLANDLEELTAQAHKAQEYLELAQRTKADFENYRKRAARDAANAQERGVAKLARELLPAIDNLDRTLEAAQAAEATVAEDGAHTLASGIKLAHTDLIAALTRAGIERFSPEGETFDPQQHEAVAQHPVEGAEPGTVVEVYQRGYRLGDAVIRPARVVVAG
ncbi:MAG: nucleotide exchange factor GrpE [Actinomycetota bacterium]|nr:nucleotide exchange factor GrpE [Actinomycetota bacterium]